MGLLGTPTVLRPPIIGADNRCQRFNGGPMIGAFKYIGTPPMAFGLPPKYKRKSQKEHVRVMLGGFSVRRRPSARSRAAGYDPGTANWHLDTPLGIGCSYT